MGRIMEMSVQSAAPRNAQTESKAGKAMEMPNNTATTNRRMAKRVRKVMSWVRRVAGALV